MATQMTWDEFSTGFQNIAGFQIDSRLLAFSLRMGNDVYTPDGLVLAQYSNPDSTLYGQAQIQSYGVNCPNYSEMPADSFVLPPVDAPDADVQNAGAVLGYVLYTDIPNPGPPPYEDAPPPDDNPPPDNP
jgi:hypothetical protein